MRISLFTHDSIPGVDAPLCNKSKSYIRLLIEKGEAFMLDLKRAQLFPPKVEWLDWSEQADRPRHWQGSQLIEGDIEGRNSCRSNGRGEGHFSYPIPACGARARGTSAPNFWRPPVAAPIGAEAFS